MSGIRGNSARILLMSSAASFALNGVAVAETLSFEGDDPFASLETMSVDELMDARGGYSAGGFKFNIGVNVAPVTVTPVKPLPEGGALGGKGALPEGGALGGKGALPDGGALGGKGALPQGGALPNGALGNKPSDNSSNNVTTPTTTTVNTAQSAPVVNTPTSAPPAAEPVAPTPVPTTTTPLPTVSTPASEPTPPAAETTPTVVATTETPTTMQPEPVVTTTTAPEPVVETTTIVNMGGNTPAPEVTKTAPPMTGSSESAGSKTTYASFLNIDIKDIANVSRGGARSSAVDDNTNPRSAPPTPGVTPGDPASSIKPAGDTVIQQEGYTVSVDNTRDAVQVNLTTEYTVRFENYREGVEMAIGARVTQTALGTQSLLGGLSN